MLGPLDGPQMSQMRATLCVISSIALVALGGSDLTGGLCLGTLSVAGLSTIVGSILDMVVVSWDVEGTSCKELGWHINSCLLCLFTALARAHCFAPRLLHHGAIKLAVTPAHKLHHLARSPIVSPPPSLRLRRKGDRKIDLEIRGSY
jgi:hypothetical protein